MTPDEIHPTPPPEGPELPPAPPWPRRMPLLDALNVLLLTACAFLVREWRLGLPPTRYFDETYYVKAAKEYLAHVPDTNTVHPPMGKLIIAAFMQLYDMVASPLQQMGVIPMVSDSASWRVASLVLGSLMVPVTYALAFRMFRSRFVAVVAAFLLSIDFLHVVQSRITMLDMPLSFLVLLGSYGAWRFITTDRQELGWALFSALCFGIGAGCKWNALFGASGAFAAMLLLKSWPSTRAFVGWAFSLLALYAVAIPCMYTLSFWPFFAQGQTLQQMADNHKLMVTFRYGPDFKHRYMSRFWQWPTVLRPIWYHYEEHPDPEYSVFPRRNDTTLGRLAWRGEKPETYVDGVVAIGSPWVWWTFFLLLLLTLVQSVLFPLWATLHRALRPRPPPRTQEEPLPLPDRWGVLARGLHEWRLGPDRPFLFLLLMYFPQLLLWSVNKGFFFYMLPCVPYMCIFLAAILREWLELPWGRLGIALYLGVALFFFVAYYPLLTAYPIPKPLYKILIPPWASWWI